MRTLWRRLAPLLLAALVSPARGGDGPPDLSRLSLQDLRGQGGESGPGPAPVAVAAQRDGVDLSAQFPDPPTRDQKNVGDCHAFSAVALLEAALFRQHGERVRLSEADLFLNATVLGRDFYTPTLLASVLGPKGECAPKGVREGASPIADLEFALSRGVATALDYEGFLQRYRQWRGHVNADLAAVKRQHEALPWNARLMSTLFYEPRAAYAEALETPELKAGLERYLSAQDRGQLESQRAQVKAQLGSFKVLRLDRDKARDELVRSLDAGVPVLMAMDLAGLASWGRTGDKCPFPHGFVITGYRRQGGGLAFQTRNSWGGKNPEVLESELDRLILLTVVRVPKDA